ncbi:hypothetical protein JTE90_017201 [Oedothorax gibbosus]|uniref:Uncharacterized protein n=1 Tax=Oedothorax gibbosus TaxID=931172 RepID=A0AAV6V9M5_9ARAC|nr:hypothetical protein JTE90_017201 [Oedothorax gibbosus]
MGNMYVLIVENFGKHLDDLKHETEDSNSKLCPIRTLKLSTQQYPLIAKLDSNDSLKHGNFRMKIATLNMYTF